MNRDEYGNAIWEEGERERLIDRLRAKNIPVKQIILCSNPDPLAAKLWVTWGPEMSDKLKRAEVIDRFFREYNEESNHDE